MVFKTGALNRSATLPDVDFIRFFDVPLRTKAALC
jgi:hypothetical protein